MDRFFAGLAVRLLRQSGAGPVPAAELSAGCVAEQVDRLRVFGDAPRQLSALVRRSFVVARNFVHGLAVGRDIIAALDDVCLSIPFHFTTPASSLSFPCFLYGVHMVAPDLFLSAVKNYG